MFIVLHCSGLPFNGETIKTQSLGGSETAAYYMAKELAASGHEVVLFTNSQDEGIFDGVKYSWLGEISQQAPLGDRFQRYAVNVPHDVLIIQRHPMAFTLPYAAKIKLWWVHDLAQGRNVQLFANMAWNMDGVLTVSEFHKQQYVEALGINPEVVYPIQNGVDLSLFENGFDTNLFELSTQTNLPKNAFNESVVKEFDSQFKLLYTSRPERGLEHLVAPGGIMEQLAETHPNAHLYVCGYENTTPQVEAYYNHLWSLCDKLPNVTNLGALSKQTLADVMRQCDLMVYPTPGPQQPDFVEVSCITAMECMAAGLPFLSTANGALPETCKDSGSMLIEPLEDGQPDIGAFTSAVGSLINDQTVLKQAKNAQLAAVKRYDWRIAAEMLLGHIDTCFKRHRSNGAIARHLMESSDIYMLDKFENTVAEDSSCNDITVTTDLELATCYDFAFSNNWTEHYERYYAYEKARGVNYGPEDLTNNARFEYVAGVIGNLPVGVTVLDYGCAHGHYTVNLAKRFPDRNFVGVDITASNIEKARAWATDEGLTNIRFIHGSFEEDGFALTEQFDAIIAAEVIEHVGHPRTYISNLLAYAKPHGKMIITVPFGPWEAQGYKEHWPWRAHVWHFERHDLQDLWGHMDDFNITVISHGHGKQGSLMGSHVVTFNKTDGFEQGIINAQRKFDQAAPRQTLSICMIVRNGAATLVKTLNSVADHVDEIVIGLDATTDDDTKLVLDRFVEARKGLWPIIKIFEIDSPLKTGFAAARNKTVELACGDWVMWIDADEEVVGMQNIYKYLRNNQYDGYLVKQHHFSIEPLGVLQTDMPCRLFRNNIGIQFFGLVHEHPETKLNAGPGHVQLLPDIEIAHHGYTTEAIRRERFKRNIALMAEDRQQNPERELGKMLWIRDLAQMNMFEHEANGGKITGPMIARCHEGIKIWEELLHSKSTKVLNDSLRFYTILAEMLGSVENRGFFAKVGFECNPDQAVLGAPLGNDLTYFYSREHAIKFAAKMIDWKAKPFEAKYY